ncbi:metallophosphoesterase [Nocardioides anomalus]|uniref:Metallophosphoesterase n=1 Tax=Nocardioides anomalus TaxID=2712223 RepID=A0A6G6WFL0_9ACTN|nr:metallophosphoesterase [Nocardioides anomalus]QIG43999.1 metallophosphoesterase [Nocardioides anomalus]
MSRVRPLLAATGLALSASLLAPAPPVGASDRPRLATAAWAPPADTGPVALVVHVDAGRPATFRVRLTGGSVDVLPDACEPSSVVVRHSWLSDDGASLVCRVASRQAADVTVAVDPAAGPGALTARVEADGAVLDPGALAVPAGRTDVPRTLRLLSSPDFLNADVGRLPAREVRGTNRSYERALDAVLSDWASKAPDAVLVAGDLVDGHWDRDDRHERVFGPVRTHAQQVRAVHRAAATFYPQYLRRFERHGLDLYPAIGDHEYGDDPWPGAKRRLAPVFAREFARHFTRRFADHPSGRHAGTAYAWRPSPDVQVVSIDPFDITPGRSRLRLDDAQQRWLVRVLGRAQADGVRWTIVQGHVPVLQPVRARGSSDLHYAGGARSRLWRTFERYGVDLYLAGEVHDTTASAHGGVVQLAHGGAFQYGLTTYALLDVHEDRIDVTLEDYDVRVGWHGPRLWETARRGLPGSVRVHGAPYTIGTLSIGADGGLTRRSGLLTAYRP